ncbi:hypothetical protein [Aeromonas hydrophila]|uniref:hypothetical protein n=1 Tax=Aeromonas hydrophila TaxID=644 RepID=UPI00301ACDC4
MLTRSMQLLFLALALASPLLLQAQPSQSDLRGRWLVTVEGERDTRTLIIAEVAPTDGGALLSARYGLTKSGQGVIDAKLARVGETRQLNLVTQAATIITATEQPDGTFKGSFARKNGVVSEVTISRASDQAANGAVQTDPVALVSLAADLPVECAAFHGAWSGVWSIGGGSAMFLRVAEIVRDGEGCSARFSFSPSNTPVPARFKTQITGNSMSFVCNRTTGGTCVFKHVGDDLWASYSNSAGGSNSATFRRVPQ